MIKLKKLLMEDNNVVNKFTTELNMLKQQYNRGYSKYQKELNKHQFSYVELQDRYITPIVNKMQTLLDRYEFEVNGAPGIYRAQKDSAGGVRIVVSWKGSIAASKSMKVDDMLNGVKGGVITMTEK